MSSRKRKFHLLYYNGSQDAVCGAWCVRDYTKQDNPIANGLFRDQVKSACKITCKACRKSYHYDMVKTRLNVSKAISMGAHLNAA